MLRFVCLMSLLVGCSIQTKTPEGNAVSLSKEEFGRYVEQVFRHHNAVMNQLILAADTQIEWDADRLAEFEEAEFEMNEACYVLNELISMEVVGGKSELQVQTQLMSSVPECEVATRKVELALYP